MSKLHFGEAQHDIKSIVLFDGDESIGIAEIETICDEIWFNNFAIRTDLRGKGWGQKFLQMAIEQYGVNTLTCAVDNKVAYHIYKKLGFEVVATLQSYDHGDTYKMKRLQKEG